MSQDDARDFLSNVLDRCAAGEGPFWESSPEQRDEVSVLLGSPTVTVSVARDAEGEPRLEAAADLFLGTAILAEVAIELAQTPHAGRSREEAIFTIRERLSQLLPPVDEV